MPSSVGSTRAAVRGLGARLLLAVPIAIAALPAAAQAATTRLDTAGCGGTSGGVTANEFVVPAGVTSITVDVQGGEGGQSGGMAGGGLGARVSGTISVTPGSTLYACVARSGGAGGVSALGPNGAAGGGYALLTRFSDLSSPYAIAGGGGGAGAAFGLGMAGAGGDAALPGLDASSGGNSGNAAGGMGAWSGGAGSAGTNSTDLAANGVAGTIRAGGVGGAGQDSGSGGGGGGGGVWGGGGGAGSHSGSSGHSSAAGGGGGNSYCDMGASCSAQLAAGTSYVELTYTPPTQTTTSVAPDVAPAPGDKPVTLTATVSPVPTGGTVAFLVDGNAVGGCGAQSVNTTTGKATCTTTAPRTGGAHTVKATYSGTTGFTGSDKQEAFTVSTAKVTISGQYDFGTVLLGGNTTRTLTVGNAGDAALDINSHAVYVSPLGPAAPPASTDFKVVDDQCSSVTLAPGQTCTFTVRFKPALLGERTAEAYVSTNSETHFPQTTLTGIAVQELPPAPTPTPEPPTTPTPPAPTPTPAPPVATPAPLKVSVSIPGRRATRSRAAIPVDPAKPLTIGCDTTTTLDSCAIAVTVRVARKDVTIGRAVTKPGQTDARIRLNAKGRKLLAGTPQGLDVKVAVTGRGPDGTQTASTTTRLVANRTVTLLDGFATNSAELTAKGRAFVDDLARRLKSDTFKRIVVTGHTDSSGPASDAYRKALGLARARSIVERLSAAGLKARFTARSAADKDPAVAEKSADGEARNRRVTLELHR